MKKIVYSLLVFGPLCYLGKLPYLFRAWCNSPLDRWDWIVLPAALLAAMLAYWNTPLHLRRRPFTPFRLIPLGISLAVYILAQMVSVNSFSILAAAAVWWCCCFTALNSSFATALLPAFVLLCLGCTSSTYWIGYFLAIPTWMVIFLKGATTVAMLILAAFHIKVKIEALSFLLVSVGGLIAWHNADVLSKISEPLVLEPERNLRNCIMRKLPPDAASLHFFRGSQIQFYTYADDSNVYHLLEIRKSGNIHSIHPASHCLRSGGREILSEETVNFQIRGRLIPLTLIHTRRQSEQELSAVWYSSPVCSCSGFLAFRRHWRRKHDWRIYQFTIKVNGSPKNARMELERMINALALK